MKRRSTKKLALNRETLRHLSHQDLEKIAAGAVAIGGQSIQSGETYCWCTDTCDCETR